VSWFNETLPSSPSLMCGLESTGNAMKPAHILLAEDNSGDVLLIRHALREHDVPFALHVAPDGAAAIDFVLRMGTPGVPCPDLVLLDLNLPKVDGAEILSAMHALGVLRDTGYRNNLVRCTQRQAAPREPGSDALFPKAFRPCRVHAARRRCIGSVSQWLKKSPICEPVQKELNRFDTILPWKLVPLSAPIAGT